MCVCICVCDVLVRCEWQCERERVREKGSESVHGRFVHVTGGNGEHEGQMVVA